MGLELQTILPVAVLIAEALGREYQLTLGGEAPALLGAQRRGGDRLGGGGGVLDVGHRSAPSAVARRAG